MGSGRGVFLWVPVDDYSSSNPFSSRRAQEALDPMRTTTDRIRRLFQYRQIPNKQVYR